MAVPQERATVTYCSLDTLRGRGWFPSLVQELLGEPDRLDPVQLYLTPRVEEAERSESFRQARVTRLKRIEAARAAADRRREEAIEAIRTVPMDLPSLTPDELARRAVAHRNVLDAERACHQWGHVPSPATVETTFPAVLHRWEVGYLRHRLSRHRALLEALPPGDSRAEGIRLLTERTYAAIAAAYPALELECRRQQSAPRAV